MSKPKYVPKPVPSDKREKFMYDDHLTGEWFVVKRVPIEALPNTAVWVSECGRCVVKFNARCGVFKRAKFSDNGNGYLVTGIFDGVKARPQPVHRLVAWAWIGLPSSKHLQVCHYDGDKLNNHYKNLRWGTIRDNADDRLRHGDERGLIRAKERTCDNKRVKPILRTILYELYLQGFSMGAVASELDIDLASVSRAVRGEQTYTRYDDTYAKYAERLIHRNTGIPSEHSTVDITAYREEPLYTLSCFFTDILSDNTWGKSVTTIAEEQGLTPLTVAEILVGKHVPKSIYNAFKERLIFGRVVAPKE